MTNLLSSASLWNLILQSMLGHQKIKWFYIYIMVFLCHFVPTLKSPDGALNIWHPNYFDVQKLLSYGAFMYFLESVVLTECHVKLGSAALMWYSEHCTSWLGLPRKCWACLPDISSQLLNYYFSCLNKWSRRVACCSDFVHSFVYKQNISTLRVWTHDFFHQ